MIHRRESDTMPSPAGRLTISVVIPALNEERLLPGCLAALSAQTDAVDEIVVVDNNSVDRTAEIARAVPGVVVVAESHAGITYARTAGFDAARCDIIARIDADSIVAPDWAATIRREFSADPALAAIAGGAAVAELSPGSRFWMKIHYRLFRFWHERSLGVAPMIYGFNGALRRSAWEVIRGKITLGDTQISEDVDVTICLLSSGLRIKFVPQLVVKAHLFRTMKVGKLSEYYRTDGVTLRKHQYGNPKRWESEKAEHPTVGLA